MNKNRRHKIRQRRVMLTPSRMPSRISDNLRQLLFPAEFRITAPILSIPRQETADGKLTTAAQTEVETSSASEGPVSDRMVIEFATCLWYLKTKHFKRDWESDDDGDDDPRVRRTLGRLNRGIASLKEGGVEVHDPTNKRYPQGGENMMMPVQFQPTKGLTFEMVTETVTPIIYWNDRLIQCGEVFVAVPEEPVSPITDRSSQPADSETVACGPGEPAAAEDASNPATVEATQDADPDTLMTIQDKATYDKSVVQQADESGDLNPESVQVDVEPPGETVAGQPDSVADDKHESEQCPDSSDDGDKEARNDRG